MASCPTIDSESQPRKPVYLIAGGKGGVGKSMLTMVVIDQLLLLGTKVLYFETDTANPDVWFSLERDGRAAPGEAIDGVVMHTVLIEEAEAWSAMINAIAEHPDHVVVIGTASRTLDAIRKNGYIMTYALPRLERELVTLWVVDELRDSVNQLKDHLEVFPDTETHVIKNSIHRDFFYDRSEVRPLIEARGGQSLRMPRLDVSVVRSLYEDRFAISKALEVIPIGNQAILYHFRSSCQKLLRPILVR